jgi:hypothetical protein
MLSTLIPFGISVYLINEISMTTGQALSTGHLTPINNLGIWNLEFETWVFTAAPSPSAHKSDPVWMPCPTSPGYWNDEY